MQVDETHEFLKSKANCLPTYSNKESNNFPFSVFLFPCNMHRIQNNPERPLAGQIK